MLDSGLLVAFAFGPTGVASVAGIVIAVMKWRAEPVVARLALIGLVLLLVSTIVGVFGVPSVVDIAGWTVDEVRQFYTAIGIIVLVLTTIAWVLLLTALFVRLPARATAQAAEAAEPADADGPPTGRHVLLDDDGQPVVAETGQFLSRPRTSPGFPAVGAGAAGAGVAGAAFGTGVFAEPRTTDGPPGDVVSPEASPDAGEESPTQALPLLGASGPADEGTPDQSDETSGGRVATAAGEPVVPGAEDAPAAGADEPAFDPRALDDDAFDPYGIPRDRAAETSTPPDGAAAPVAATSSSDRSPATSDDAEDAEDDADAAVEVPTAAPDEPAAGPGSPAGRDTETRAFPVASPDVEPEPDEEVSATPATTGTPELEDDPGAPGDGGDGGDGGDEDHGAGDDIAAAEPEVADQSDPGPTAAPATGTDPDPEPESEREPETEPERATVSDGADGAPTPDPVPATERPTATGVAGPLPTRSHHPWFTPTGVDDPSSGAASSDEDTADADERSTRTGG